MFVFMSLETHTFFGSCNCTILWVNSFYDYHVSRSLFIVYSKMMLQTHLHANFFFRYNIIYNILHNAPF